MLCPNSVRVPIVSQTLINQIPRHAVFISAFAGRCGVLQRIRKCRHAIAIDADPVPLKWWAAADAARSGYLELINTDAVSWSRHHFGLDRLSPDPSAMPAVPPKQSAKYSGTMATDPAAVDGGSFVFADPPYPANVRSGACRRIYRHEQLTDDAHERILNTFCELPCPAMICGIKCDLYDQLLSEWRTIEYQVVYRSGKQTTETAWMNYDPPEELHDYQYLGANRREREVLTKRRRNLMRRLKDMGPHERRSLLLDLEAASPDSAILQ